MLKERIVNDTGISRNIFDIMAFVNSVTTPIENIFLFYIPYLSSLFISRVERSAADRDEISSVAI